MKRLRRRSSRCIVTTGPAGGFAAFSKTIGRLSDLRLLTEDPAPATVRG